MKRKKNEEISFSLQQINVAKTNTSNTPHVGVFICLFVISFFGGID